MVRREHRIFITDSRSYSGTTKFSDHRLVMAKFNINWQWKTPKKVTSKKYDTMQLKNPETRQIYQDKVTELINKAEPKNEQEQWNNIVHACHQAAGETLGMEERKRPNKTVNDPEVKKLSEEQKQIRIKINAKTSKEKERPCNKREMEK